MNAEPSFLGRALLLSLMLHAGLLAAGERLIAQGSRAERPALAALTVYLPGKAVAPEPHALRSEQWLAPRDPLRNASADRPRAPATRQTAALRVPTDEAARDALAQMARELPYPPEAIERGLQGEALVLLFLDASGDVIAARLEASSGHALLDDAAVRAARTLRAFPAGAPREALLPVRFRLR